MHFESFSVWAQPNPKFNRNEWMDKLKFNDDPGKRFSSFDIFLSFDLSFFLGILY